MTDRSTAIPAQAGRAVARLLFSLPWVQRRWARRYRSVESAEVPWSPLRKPLAECRVALVTTAGVHLADDVPFDMGDPQGDPSFRAIPSGAAAESLRITHDYYDHRSADRDPNVVFPLHALRQLQAEGRVGPSAERFFSLMGHIEGPHLKRLVQDTAPAVAAALRAQAVDIAVFTPA